MECLADVRAVLGEGPCWDTRGGSLLWVDINTPVVFQWSARDGLQTHEVSEKICSIVPRAAGGYIGAGYNGLVTLSDDFAIKHVGHPEQHLAGNRFNDGKVDREGRFWAGTMDHAEHQSSGTLYRIDNNLSWKAIDTGYHVTNGPAFSIDGRTMYHTDSAAQRVYIFDLDINGDATNRRTFLQFTPDMGYPDGMTVDAENCVWNLETCIRGASERLPSVLMTALVTALGLLPLAAGSGQPGREIEGPMATIIVGGLVTSTILNLLILPAIMLHFGRFEKQGNFEKQAML